MFVGKKVLLLNMNGTFMFGEDRFGESEDFSIGLGAILATSATLYATLKWFGVGYLIYLGIKVWREEPKIDSASPKGVDTSTFGMFRSSFVVTALNPKDIVFFVAFLPSLWIQLLKPFLNF